jgi:Protein of unknown function (DUF2505)
MGKFTVTHEINCDAETFWKVFFDKSFNDELYLKELGFPEYKTLEQNETDTKITRKVHGQPKMDVPGPIAKLLGSSFSYIEEGSMDRASKLWRWKLLPSTLAEKLRTEGTVRIEPIGDSKVRRVAEIEVEAKIFGVGGLMESSAEKQLRQGWDSSAAFMNKYLARDKT